MKFETKTTKTEVKKETNANVDRVNEGPFGFYAPAELFSSAKRFRMFFFKRPMSEAKESKIQLPPG